MNHLFPSTSRQHLYSSRVFYRIRVAHLFSFPYCDCFILLVLVESLMEQELLTLLEHLSSSPRFSGVRVTRSLVLCVCFVNRCLSFCTFCFDHCAVCSSSIYGYWLTLWYIHTVLSIIYLFTQYFFLHYPIALLIAYTIMIGLYIFTNNIQGYSQIFQVC